MDPVVSCVSTIVHRGTSASLVGGVDDLRNLSVTQRKTSCVYCTKLTSIQRFDRLKIFSLVYLLLNKWSPVFIMMIQVHRFLNFIRLYSTKINFYSTTLPF